MSINHKIEKYEHKIANTNNISRKSAYTKKLKQYQMLNMHGGKNELMKPVPIDKSNLTNYSLKKYIGKNTIAAIGYGAMDKNKPLEHVLFERRSPKDNDVLIEILYSGICHSDWHFITGEWEAEYPLIPGHEIVGRVIGLGDNTTKFKIGDYVAVGPAVDSCGKCARCNEYYEQYCINGVTEVYNSFERKPGDIKPSGPITYGGYSNIVVVKDKFVFKVPDNLDIKRVPPLMCAAATMYQPLKQMITKPGVTIGIAGIGGLGHIGVKLAKAMGAKVVAITHTDWKIEDSIRLGADNVILSTDFQQMEAAKGTLDFIISTIPVPHNIDPYVELLKFRGGLWIVGSLFPMAIDPSSLSFINGHLISSILAGTAETQELLDFCSEHEIMPDVELISVADINGTRLKLLESKVKYRFVIDLATIQK